MKHIINEENSKKTVLATILAVFGVLISIAATYYTINQKIEKSAYDELKNSTIQMAYEIRTSITKDTHMLRVLASSLAVNDEIDSNKTQSIIGNFNISNSISHLEILLPDDRIMTPKEGYVYTFEGNFEAEAQKGEYISDLTKDAGDGYKDVIMNVVPIKKNGNVTAILYGVVELDEISDIYKSDIFDGKSSTYIIDGTTGDYLLDTWHKTRSNINSFGGRDTKEGFDLNETRENLKKGKSGYMCFKSKSINEYLYGCYVPVGINNWSVMLSVPESIIFSSLNLVKKIIYVMTTSIIVILSIYFIWLIRREIFEKKRIGYMLLIEKKLAGAHRNHKNITDALQIVSEKVHADTAFYIDIDGDVIRHVTTYSHTPDFSMSVLEGSTPNSVSEYLKPIFETEHTTTKRGKAIIVFDEQAFKKRYVVNSYMTVPIKNSDNVFVGTLGVLNLKKKYKNTFPLEDVAIPFSIAANNLHSYNMIKDLGMRDKLTGLLNRNSYEKSQERYRTERYSNIACIYMDANGLHDLNNECGHEAGDRMLKTVADAMLGEIGKGNVYRIGGDEFIAFIENKSENEVYDIADAIEKIVTKHGYSLAVGIDYSSEETDIKSLVKRAEGRMYESKRRHYSKKSTSESGTVQWNAETLVSLLEPKLKICYIVDIAKDKTVKVFLPSSMRYNFATPEKNFSADFMEYIENKTSPESGSKLIGLINYELLMSMLDKENPVTVYYKTSKGKDVSVSVYKTAKYGCGNNFETVWLFRK